MLMGCQDSFIGWKELSISFPPTRMLEKNSSNQRWRIWPDGKVAISGLCLAFEGRTLAIVCFILGSKIKALLFNPGK